MTIQHIECALPYPQEQIFDLAADIERYPQFVPLWISARIRRRESDICHVEQVLGYGPVRLRFTSEAVLQRPTRIDVRSSDPPFRRYSLSMLFTSRSADSCDLSITSEVDLESGLLQHLVDRLTPGAVDNVVAAFAARADCLYGGRRGWSGRAPV